MLNSVMSVSSFFPGWSAWKSLARRFGTSGESSPLCEAVSSLPHVCDFNPFIPHYAPHNLLGDGHAFPFEKMEDAPISVPAVVLLE